MHPSHHIELRLLLTCFYIYLNYQTLIYIKQVTFHYSLLTSPFQYPYTYIHIRAIPGNCTLFIYRCLLLYALWYKMSSLFLISIIFHIGLLCLRIIFDFYGYYSGYIIQSLYYPFQSFQTKSIIEEIIDFIFEFIQNSFGLILSIYMFTDTVNNNNRSRRVTRESIHRLSVFD
jgi:hypothetical protein